MYRGGGRKKTDVFMMHLVGAIKLVCLLMLGEGFGVKLDFMGDASWYRSIT